MFIFLGRATKQTLNSTPFSLPLIPSRNATVTKDDICMACYLIALYLPQPLCISPRPRILAKVLATTNPHSSLLSAKATIPFCLKPCVEDRDVRKASEPYELLLLQYSITVIRGTAGALARMSETLLVGM